MSTITVAQTASLLDTDTGTARPSPLRRFVGVVAHPDSYRNIAFLLLGLPLGTVWFSVLVSGASIAASMVVVALIGVPMLLGLWYVTRAFANFERGVANALLGQRLPVSPMNSPRGNIWMRLRSMSHDRDRWRELGYLMLRFPVGIATFIAAVTAIATPFLVAYAPIVVRHDDQPFGDWALSSRMEDVASNSPWSWLLVPLGVVMLFVSFHLMNAMARACARWATAWLSGA
ncbi:MAG: sensor domain-containing protein [Acidimicrobiales bacterium]